MAQSRNRRNSPPKLRGYRFAWGSQAQVYKVEAVYHVGSTGIDQLYRPGEALQAWQGRETCVKFRDFGRCGIWPKFRRQQEKYLFCVAPIFLSRG